MESMTQYKTSAEAQEAFENQGSITPGTEGFWRVWGAQVRHIQIGDLVASKNGDEVEYDPNPRSLHR